MISLSGANPFAAWPKAWPCGAPRFGRRTAGNDPSVLIASYNVQNLCDIPVISGRYTTRPKSAESLAAMAETIRRLNPDILALQEVQIAPYRQGIPPKDAKRRIFRTAWNAEEHMHPLLDRLNAQAWQNRYRVIKPDTNSKRGLGLALLYQPERIDFLQSVEFYDAVFQRALVGAKFACWNDAKRQGEPLSCWVFNVHLKSRLPSSGEQRPEVIRQAEARRIREILGKLFEKDPQAHVVLTGDFNASLHRPEDMMVLKDLCLMQGHDAKLRPVTGGKPSYRHDKSQWEKNYEDADHLLLSRGLIARHLVKAGPAGDFNPGSDHRPIAAKLAIQAQEGRQDPDAYALPGKPTMQAFHLLDETA